MEAMMFDGANAIFDNKDKDMFPLPAKCVGKQSVGQTITCWQLSREEIEKVQETGIIYLSLLTYGQGIPPILMSVDEPEVYAPSE